MLKPSQKANLKKIMDKMNAVCSIIYLKPGTQEQIGTLGKDTGPVNWELLKLKRKIDLTLIYKK